jgi:hypothetical protein
MGTVSVKADATRRKRLGQYFTGNKLANLLVALAEASHYRSAIDPMCGSGDMLASVLSVSPQASLAGIEIDDNAFNLCAGRFKGANNQTSLIHGNVFSWSSISHLPNTSFDLVITNPPYVRYQSFASVNEIDQGKLPRAEEIRRGLREVAHNLPNLEEKDREIFVSIVKEYSGLSDLAVPSWILCMMLTKVGGRLAMVVPDSWLNRDYAYPIHYLLLKLFRILWVVEDANRVWFKDAQVKTTLLVAERIPRADDLWAACTQRNYIQASLPASVITEHSIVGGIFPGAANPDADFAHVLSRLSDGMDTGTLNTLSVTRRDLSGKLADLLAASSGSRWFRYCEPELTQSAASGNSNNNGVVKVPQALLDLLPSADTSPFTTIEALGAHVGQGLRTGANEFFYCDLISETDNECMVMPGKALKASPVSVPKAALRPVLRKQSEVPKSYLLTPTNLRGRVLLLEGFIHPDDIAKSYGEGNGKDSTSVTMTPALTSFVSSVERLNVGTEEQPKWIPQMSAVRTNETKSKIGGNKTRFWYMLPKLAKRHQPDLFIPRINYLHPKTFLNSDEKTIIDANFSTIWLDENASVDAFALLACLNSIWVVISMELSAAVMGGGALKLEATHIRRLPIPVLSAQQWDELSTLGHKLANKEDSETILNEINVQIAQALFGKEKMASALEKIESINSERLAARNRK